MNATVKANPIPETLESRPDCRVEEAEYRRLLGYPRDHVPEERARELAGWARRWFEEHGRPWLYLREAELILRDGDLLLDGVPFFSKQLHRHFRLAEPESAVLVAVSAGRAPEDRAQELWRESKPDEYFFLEIFASAVVERLVAAASGRICEMAERDGMIAVPHYSPGYAGWDAADQNRLFELIEGGMKPVWPEPIEVLPSGMLRPKKSLLAVFGLTLRTERALASARLLPCQACSYSPCRYRRAPYRPGPATRAGPAR